MSDSSSPINSDYLSSEDEVSTVHRTSLVDNHRTQQNRRQELQNLKDQNREAWKNAIALSSSTPRRRRRFVDRGRVEGVLRLYKDYFSENAVYHGDFFRRRFRMRRSLFDRIHFAVKRHENYFEQKVQCTGEMGLSPLQKTTAAIHMLAYGCCADQCDEYLRIGESTALECMRRFCASIIQCFAKEYLRQPTSADMDQILEENAKQGFPEMLEILDCMLWNWKNCSAAWRGSYKNYKGYTSIVLEAITSYDGWFWHGFFGMLGSFNDVNVMNTSNVFARMMEGNVPSKPYWVNGHEYKHHYCVRDPRTRKVKNFARFHEGCRKDIERAFWMLQARWGIIKRPTHSWSKDVVNNVMIACIILHNMITEDEKNVPPCDYLVLKHYQKVLKSRLKSKVDEEKKLSKCKVMEGRYKEFVDGYAQLRSTAMHEKLKEDLTEHIWRESNLGNIQCGSQQ